MVIGEIMRCYVRGLTPRSGECPVRDKSKTGNEEPTTLGKEQCMPD